MSEIRLYEPAGTSGLRISGGRVYEEWLGKLRQGGAWGVSVYREMSDNSPIIGSMIFAIQKILEQAEINFRPSDDKNPEAVAVAEFTTEAFEGMEQTWTDLLSEILTMLTYGWSLMDVIYRRDAKGRIVWDSMEIRSQDSLDRWEQEAGTERVLGMWQRTQAGHSAYIPLDKALLFRTVSNKNNPEGRSVLRNAYRPWSFVVRAEDAEGIGIYRDLAGMPMATVPPEIMSPEADPAQSSLRQQIERMVQQVHRDEREGLVIPAAEYTNPSDSSQVIKTGYSFSLLQSGGASRIDADKIIRRHEQRMLSVCLADFIILGQDKVGSFALSDSKTNMFSLACNGFFRRILDVFNKTAIPRMMRLNAIPRSLWPYMAAGDVETPSLQEFSASLTSLASTGLITPDAKLESHIREVADLPPQDAEELSAPASEAPAP